MKKGKRLWSLLTITALLVTSLNPVPSLAAGSTKVRNNSGIITKTDETKKLDELKQKMKGIAASSSKVDLGYKDNQIVNIIVELKDTTLLDTYKNTKTISENKSFDEFVTTSKAETLTNELLKNQGSVLKRIETLDKNVKVNKIYNYTAVMNGFSIKTEYKLLNKIKDLKEVKSAFVSPFYEKVKPEPALDKSVPFIGAEKTWKDTGFRGEGMVVAIVDTGLDTSHEAFSYLPTVPRIHKSDIKSIFDTTVLSSENLDVTANADSVYVSDKIPYAYDYADKDSEVSGGDSHGTHVAGTVAASGSAIVASGGAIEIEKGILGVAPEAQLMIFKVFSDKDSSAYTSDIIAGLDDAVKLGVDAINMSLGSVSGFTDEGEEAVNEVYNRIKASGINLACSAGNNHSLSYNNNLGGKSLTSNPDTSVVGSPSTYDAALSVASLKNAGVSKEQFSADGKGIIYTDNASKGQRLNDVLKGDYEFVDAGLGLPEDYAKIDAKDKIALVKRGSISFSIKEANAYAAGAKAVIIYNNTAGTISMQVDSYDIPAVSITMEDGLYLKGLAKKEVKVDSNLSIDQSGYASDFSSWGVTPDLKLKPEIAAPGEGIYSSVPGGYALMSGTSMASPHIAGASALVKEYVNQRFKDLTSLEKEDLVNQIMMSTATPIISKENNLPFSPRKQGAGMINIYNAVTTGSYLYVSGQSRSKIELGDDVEKKGQYEFKFNVKNVTGSAITYDINATTLTEKVIDSNYLAEDGYKLSPAVKLEASNKSLAGNTLTVGAKEEVTVTVTLTLSKEDKEYLDNNFINGEFVEGYISLDARDDVDLSIPYMGFYGDWTKAPIMDSESLYEGINYQQTSSEAYNVILNSYQFVLGENVYASLAGVTLPVDKNKIAISPNGDYYFDSVDAVTTSLLRNAKNINYQVLDDKNNVLYSTDAQYERNSFYVSSQGIINYAINTVAWKGTKKDGSNLPNNTKCTYKVTGTLDYDAHKQNNAKGSWEFPVTIDTEAPIIKNTKLYEKDGKQFIDVTVSDNQYVSTIALYTDKDKEIKSEFLNESKREATSVVTFDITGLLSNQFSIAVVDYALNEQDFNVNYDINIELDKAKLELKVGDVATLKVQPQVKDGEKIVVEPSVKWVSSDDTVATVKDGLITAVKTGEATIAATTIFGKEAICKVTIVKPAEPTTEPTIAPTIKPTTAPTTKPTTVPTSNPTTPPITNPTTAPSTTPTTTPVTTPKPTPTVAPTAIPEPTNPATTLLKKVKVKLSSKSKLVVGNTKKVVVSLPEGASTQKVGITYKSSNKKVATVSNSGKITAIKAGKATLLTKVSINGESKSFKTQIKVYAPYIEITKQTVSIKVSNAFTFKAKGYGLKGDIVWSVSDNKIASINSKTGKLKALKVGVVYVTVKSGNVTKTIKVVIHQK